jgi:hypothetical protein
MYTGSGTVGKIIATAAAKHLTPVSLEVRGILPLCATLSYQKYSLTFTLCRLCDVHVVGRQMSCNCR